MHGIFYRIVCLVSLLLPTLAWAAKVPAWALQPWQNPAPHFADLGVSPAALAQALEGRLITAAHAPRNISLPSAKGLRHFQQARFVSSIARVDLPATTLRRRLQDFTDYRSIFPLLTQSEVVTLNDRDVISRYRLEIPLPAMITFAIDVRMKNRLEEDGSISVMLLDGKAESLLAILGGATDELAHQPVVGRWEFVPVNDRQSLVVFTYWDQVKLKSFFARKVAEEYPELDVVRPYILTAGAVEALHRQFVTPRLDPREQDPPGLATMSKLSALLGRWSQNGPVALLEPEQTGIHKARLPLRYSTVIKNVTAPAAQSRHLTTQYARLVEPHKELKNISVKSRENGADLGLDIRVALSIIRFSIAVDLATTWEGPTRLAFHRTAGELARVRGAAEWHTLADDKQTLMLVSVAHELGEEAPLILRMAHKITSQVPYADTLGMMIVQMVAMERMKPWIEKQLSP